MNAVALHVVPPARARFEGLALLLAAAAITAILSLYLYQHGRKEYREPLLDWQVSAFDTLTGADQAIYNALYTAKDDIPGIYDDINMANGPDEKFRWPSPKDLAEFELPPFLHDRSWEQNGSLQWSLFEPLAEGEMQGTTLYLGTDGKLAGQGSFLLVVGHVHAGFRNTNVITIWWKKDNHAELPQSGFQDRLILQGWREVVPYSGAQEVKRIFGTGTEDSRKADGPDAIDADKIIKDIIGQNP